MQAKPPRPKGQRGRIDGKGCRRELYEEAVGALLGEVSLRAETLAQVVGQVSAPAAGPDRLSLARIGRLREAAASRYLRDRDVTALVGTIERLDREEAAAKVTTEVEGVPAEVAVRYLRDLEATWAAADGGLGRLVLAEALFERIDAKGFQELEVRLSDNAIAHGFAAIMPRRLELGFVGYGRGERNSAHTYQLTYLIDVGNGESTRRVLTA